ncbi:MAG: hypothetical protein HQK52_17380 [Oligoflexia bacterium]|nr:hypothetical protein [Oligoflexia bacterium]
MNYRSALLIFINFIIFILLACNLFALDPDEEERYAMEISKEFRRGTHFIYYCQKKHYACVSTKGFIECKAWRDEDKKKRKGAFRCIAIKSFKSQRECAFNQEQMVNDRAKRESIESFCTSTAVHWFQKNH